MDFPEVFNHGNINYTNDDNGKRIALADALSGWGCCCAGGTPPENFGVAMGKISEFLGEIVTPENCTKLADEYLKKDGAK